MFRSALLAAAACALVLAGLATDGSAQPAFTLQGFVGQNTTTPAPMVQVVLLEAASQRPLATAQTNFFGKYSFKGLPPGEYVVRIAEVTRPVVLLDRDVRLDIDLSVKGGVMDYAAGAAAQAGTTSAGATGGAAPAGPHDAQLAQQIAGVWWGYSGSTERRIGLCPGGVFRQFSESSYSGRGTDSLGSQTMAWGAASQGGGSGQWTISGDTQSGTINIVYQNGRNAAMRYRQIGDPGCLNIGGHKLCRTSRSCD